MFWPGAASLSNPLAVTKAYAARFEALGGVIAGRRCAHACTATARAGASTPPKGRSTPRQAIVSLGPWAPDVLEPLGIHLPLGIKRGYHRHFQLAGNVPMTRPVVDTDNGYCVTPMQQGIRLTTGAEFADRDARADAGAVRPPDAESARGLSARRAGEAETLARQAAMLSGFRPVIGPAPKQPGLWLAYGHAHWGLTLGPTTGRLVADLVTGATPFCDPAPYAAERFLDVG